METLDSSIFDLTPIPMWIEDFSEVKQLFDLWRNQGVENLYEFLSQNENLVVECAHKIKIIKVNQKVLDLFEAKNQEELCANLNLIFKKEMFEAHIHELEALWNGKTHFSSTTINYTLSGKRIDVQLRGAILPGSETTFDRILITTEDITPYQNALRQEEKNRRLAESMFI
ncbi:PAS domain-containing protein, partial [Acinetobacter baumannii]